MKKRILFSVFIATSIYSATFIYGNDFKASANSVKSRTGTWEMVDDLPQNPIPSVLNDTAAPPIYLPLVISSEAINTSPRVNAPYFDNDISIGWMSVFWFGKVTPTENYADVRIGYNNDELLVHIAVFDRRTWYDNTPSNNDLTAWDAASLFVDLDGNFGNVLDSNSYRFTGQLSWWEPRPDYQLAYRGNGGVWGEVSVPFTTDTAYIGDYPNDDLHDDRGWTITYHLPFSSLGLSGPPAQGSTWGIAVILHDRDSAGGPPSAEQPWPKTMEANSPGKWGQLRFGHPTYTPPLSDLGGSITIRHRLNGAMVKDGHVGGGTTCGHPYLPNIFNGWGGANYAGVTQVNIQNQAQLADWPCFSKFYINFPLDAVPLGKVIRSAKLTLYHFGNSGNDEPPPPQTSLIQVFTVAEDWDETTLNWNNAPYAWENVGEDWVDPLPANYPGYPGVAEEWDITRATTAAYNQGIPLRLVLYDADYVSNSGKYFYSSNVSDGMDFSRPKLTIEWGYPITGSK